MTSTLSSSSLSSSHYMNPMLHQYRKRVVLKRATHQINDPLVVKQKFNAKQKSVRFHDDMEQVRYFFKNQSPLSVKEDPPFMETSTEDYKLTQPNWPTRNQILYNTESKIRMESVQLTEGDTEHMVNNEFILEGRCRALNLSFHKQITIRYTYDLWSSYHETTGIFRESIASTSNTWDRFVFSIPVQAKKTTQTIYLALKYTVGEQEFWDNNNGLNYQIIMDPLLQEQPSSVADTTTSLPTPITINTTTPFTNHHVDNELVLTMAENKKESTKVLGRRYDFTASLTAARKPMSPPPSPPGTPLDTETFNYTPPVFFGESNVFDVNPVYTAPVTKSQPIPISSSEMTPPASPPISAEGFQMSYSDFVNKYCFYNSHSSPIYSVYSTSPSAVLS